MKIGCLLSVREKATRLPKKVLLDVGGAPLVLQLLRRLETAPEIESVVLATSTHPDDELLVNLASNAGFRSFRGSEDDKLLRYLDAAMEFEFDGVVIVDGDDPFCFPESVGQVAAALKQGDVDCVNCTELPLGAAATGLSLEALRRVIEMKDDSNTEVWGGYFFGSGRFRTKSLPPLHPIYAHPEIRLTVDYQEDYELVSAVVAAFDGNAKFSSLELMDLLVNRRPDLASINTAAQKRYEEHLARSTVVKFKDAT